ncbi:MAG TPA: SDR family oxidoreductase [Kofleriaceae bacterium]|jgi:NAD(P)-dependent dehydrogenase (short-subunit alcohol dehydrogenase family)
MKIQNAIALVTGSNRGIGLALIKELQARGAKKIYAAARDPKSIDLPGVTPVKLDVTNPADVAEAARIAKDANLVINNAGVATTTPILAPGAIDAMRAEYETNVFGLLNVSRAFAPTLANGALVNVLSVASWSTLSILATYASSKSAAWSVTNALRHELHDQHTTVSGVHVGFVDTDLTSKLDAPKLSPAVVAKAIVDGIERGDEEIIVDDFSRMVHDGLSQSAYLRPRA